MNNKLSYDRAPVDEIVGHYGIKGVHPAAQLLPMFSDEEFSSLCRDVEENGFLHPIRINDEMLLIDGRNRLQAAWALSQDPTIEKFNPPDVLGYILSENLHRRHLTRGQRAEIGEKIANLQNGVRSDSAVLNGTAVTRTQAAEMVGSTAKDISMMRTVKENAPEIAMSVATGGTTLEAAYRKANRKKKEVEAREKPEKSNASGSITLTGILDKKLVGVPYPEPRGNHRFNETNEQVDWARWTWNPVTGCLHGCRYCYAREMAYRDSYARSYPIQFAPLFHHERLDDPINTEPGTDTPQEGRVFVCSMADLFGEWVPQKWIDAVFDGALKAPDWEYLFLTKFPQRYRRINLPPKAWFGASVDVQKRVKITEKAMKDLDVMVRWVSCEPLLEPIHFNDLSWCDLLVIGAQSETQQPEGLVPAFAPEWDWVANLVNQARSFGTAVYMKRNLLGELTGTKPGMKLIQEMPRRRAF